MAQETTLQVWKWSIDKNRKTIMVPKGAKPLTVQMQNGSPVLWLLVDPSNEQERRTWVVSPTGADIDCFDTHEYLGTFQDDWFVGHVFFTFAPDGA